jgi:hypothetical protein
MDFVPEVSAIDTDVIEVDAETKAMLRSLDMGNLQASPQPRAGSRHNIDGPVRCLVPTACANRATTRCCRRGLWCLRGSSRRGKRTRSGTERVTRPHAHFVSRCSLVLVARASLCGMTAADAFGPGFVCGAPQGPCAPRQLCPVCKAQSVCGHPDHVLPCCPGLRAGWWLRCCHVFRLGRGGVPPSARLTLGRGALATDSAVCRPVSHAAAAPSPPPESTMCPREVRSGGGVVWVWAATGAPIAQLLQHPPAAARRCASRRCGHNTVT